MNILQRTLRTMTVMSVGAAVLVVPGLTDRQTDAVINAAQPTPRCVESARGEPEPDVILYNPNSEEQRLDEEYYDDETDTWVNGDVVLIELQCGGIAGPVMGGGIGVARPNSAIPKSTYGGTKMGVVKDTNLTPKGMRDYAKSKNVPVPNPSAKKASDMRTYGVYQIFGKNPATGKTEAFKFGITRAGDVRPRSQIKNCRQIFTDCQWDWVRTGVNGWYKARTWEAHHAARYKHKHPKHKCPPGMTRCL